MRFKMRGLCEGKINTSARPSCAERTILDPASDPSTKIDNETRKKRATSQLEHETATKQNSSCNKNE